MVGKHSKKMLMKKEVMLRGLLGEILLVWQMRG